MEVIRHINNRFLRIYWFKRVKPDSFHPQRRWTFVYFTKPNMSGTGIRIYLNRYFLKTE